MSLSKEEEEKKKKPALIHTNCTALDNLDNHFKPLFNPLYNLVLWNWYMLKFLLNRKYAVFLFTMIVIVSQGI